MWSLLHWTTHYQLLIVLTLLTLTHFLTTAKKSNIPPPIQRLLGGRPLFQSSSPAVSLPSSGPLPQDFQHDSPTPLECYPCTDWHDCEGVYFNLNHYLNSNILHNPTTPKTETCSAGERCVIHFSTLVDHYSQPLVKYNIPRTRELAKTRMFIVRAGCGTPDPSKPLDPSGCTATPTSTDGAYTTYANGTRTCYCSGPLCNHNSLKCAICSDNSYQTAPNRRLYIPCTEPTRLDYLLARPESEPQYIISPWAAVCYIHHLNHGIADKEDAKYSWLEAKVDNVNDYLNPPPRHCPINAANMKIENWEDEDGYATLEPCTCWTSWCNEIVKEIASYYQKPRPRCFVCRPTDCERHQSKERRRRRGETCFIRHVQNGKNDKFLLAEMGGKILPKGVELRNNGDLACTLELIDNHWTQTCYCNGARNELCNGLKCYKCSGKDCSLKHGKRTDFQTECYLPGERKECFIRYTSLEDVEAGCRTSEWTNGNDDELDQICDEDMNWTQGESDGEKTCRCEGSLCNSMVSKFPFPEDPEPTPEDPEPGQEPEPVPEQLGEEGNNQGQTPDDEDEDPYNERIPEQKPKISVSASSFGIDLWLTFTTFAIIWIIN